MKQDRLFTAIGGVDTELLERSEYIKRTKKSNTWLKWGLSAAACIVVVISFLTLSHRITPIPPDVTTPPDNSQIINGPSPGVTGPDTQIPNDGIYLYGSEAGEFHLLQLSYSAEPNKTGTSDFIIYVNEEIYRSYDLDGTYVIQPINAAPDNLPKCILDIAQIQGLSASEAAETLARELKESYTNVSEVTDSSRIGGLYIHADNGTAWNAEQLDVHFVDDHEGGVFVITAGYFTEAAEGHGARFSDMIGTFQVVTAIDEAATPDWLTQLKNTVAAVIPAVFTNQPSNAKDYLTDNARIHTYGENVSDNVSVVAINYTVDNDQAPSSAEASVRHRLGTEDSYFYITIELIYENGKWLASWAGIEK